MRAYPKGGPHRPESEKIAEKILGVAVIGTTLAVSPIAGAAVFFLGVGAAGYLFRKSDFNREIKRLEKRGYVALTKTSKGWMVQLLDKGRQRYRQIQIKNLKLPKAKWDGKWRLFIFDIPEKFRDERNYLRAKLKNLGMYNLQRSVLAYPYDCRKELDFIAEYYKMDRYATYAEVNYIDIDKELRHYFKLKR